MKESFYLKRNEISECLPQNFCERFLRVFVSKKELIEKVKKGFTKFCKKLIYSHNFSMFKFHFREFDQYPNGLQDDDEINETFEKDNKSQNDKKRSPLSHLESPEFARRKKIDSREIVIKNLEYNNNK